MLAGYEKAYASIAVLLLTGEAGYTNKPLAKHFLELGVAANHPRAVLNLAKMYESTDIVKSRKLYEQYLVLDKSAMPADEMHKILGKVKDLSRIEIVRAEEHRRHLEDIAHLVRPMQQEAFNDVVRRGEERQAEKAKMPKRSTPTVDAALPLERPIETPGKLLHQEALDYAQRGEHSKALDLFLRASFAGNKDAYASIGSYLMNGTDSTNPEPINSALAKKYLEWGAEAGRPRAMVLLAEVHYAEGVAQNSTLKINAAVELLKACQKNDPDNEKINNLLRHCEESHEKIMVERAAFNEKMGLNARRFDRDIPHPGAPGAVMSPMKDTAIKQPMAREVNNGSVDHGPVAMVKPHTKIVSARAEFPKDATTFQHHFQQALAKWGIDQHSLPTQTVSNGSGGYTLKSIKTKEQVIPHPDVNISSNGEVSTSLQSVNTLHDKEIMAKKMVAAYVVAGNKAPGPVSIQCTDTEMRSAMQKEFVAHQFVLAPQPELKRSESPMEPPAPTNGRNCS